MLILFLFVFNAFTNNTDNKIMKISLNVGTEEDYKYSINYFYDITNNKIFDEVIYFKYENSNYLELDNYVMVLGGNENNMNEYLYFINKNGITKINNDLDIKSIYSESGEEVIFEIDNEKYIVMALSELNKITK